MTKLEIKQPTILITGGAGFVGSHFVHWFLKNTKYNLILVDSLTYAGETKRLEGLKETYSDRLEFYTWDLRLPAGDNLKNKFTGVDYVFHLAAESHVDNSISNPTIFAESNVLGTINLLDVVRTNMPMLQQFFYFSCYDDKTRALTKDGLKYYNQLTKEDIVFSVNPITKELEETTIDEIIVQDYQGKMVEFGGTRVNLKVTPNHRMYYTDKTGNVVWEEAGALLNRTGLKFIKGNWKGIEGACLSTMCSLGYPNPSPEEIDAFLYICGVFVGDGFTAYQEKTVVNKSGLTKRERLEKSRCPKTGRMVALKERGSTETTTSYSYRIWFDIPEKDKARKRLEKSLDVLKVEYSTQKNKSGEHIYFGSKSWLEFFDLNFKQGAFNKELPSWAMSGSQENLKSLYDGLIDSDGCYTTGVVTYNTVSDRLAEQTVELGFKLGLHPRLSRRFSSNVFEGRTIQGESWVTYFGETTPQYLPKNNKISDETYNGKIWCLRLPKNKNFIVERNGVFAVSGNTDEVFGPAQFEAKGFSENHVHSPKNPYAASKSAAEQFVTAFANTYKIPCVITRSMNIFGEMQHKEKFIPLCIKRILTGEKVEIHGTPDKTQAGVRSYTYAPNIAQAYNWLLTEKPWESANYTLTSEVPAYHIVGEKEVDNLSLYSLIFDYIKGLDPVGTVPPANFEIVDFHSSRPGHDLRYALDGSYMQYLGWEHPSTFNESLERTVQWYLDNPQWLR